MNTLACCLFAAFSATVGELPPCDYADTEVSTNFPVTVDFAAMSRFEFSLALDALATVPVSAISPMNRIEHSFAFNRHLVKSSWNIAKVTRRGSASIDESASVKRYLPGFKILIR